MPQITPDEIDLLAKYVLSISGIKLGQSKGYLLENRFGPLLSSEGCRNFRELYLKAKGDASGRLQKEIIDAISTNETFFFRDNTPFDLLKNKIIPDLVDRRGASGNAPVPLRLWSAACSTGQEVYSIAITLLELLPDRNRFDISILGTDISSKAVAQASYGKYSKFEVERGLPAQVRQKYFVLSGSDWRIKDEIRSMARFEKQNLMQPFVNRGKFDVIFCRNVAIYFSAADKLKLFRKIASSTKADGALVVGGSENLAGIAPDFVSKLYLRGMYYQLRSFDENTTWPPVQVQRPRVDNTRKVRTAVKKIQTRKTVYDRPEKNVAKKVTVSPDKGSSSTNNLTVDKPLSRVKEKQNALGDTIESQGTSKSLSEQLAQRNMKDKNESLLNALGTGRQGPSPLLHSTQKSSSQKQSLLEKIAQQNKTKKS